MQIKDMRSLLFVPATSPHLLAKAAQRGADALIVDLEDSVPLARKGEARGMAAQALAELAGRATVLLRVNSPSELLAGDIAVVPMDHVAAVMLPKVETAQQVQWLASELAKCREGGVPIVALIETALGVVNAQQIAQSHPSVLALGFGAEDYAAEMSVSPHPDSLLWPAQQVTTCARACDLACFGLAGSIAETEDMDAFAQLVAQGRAIGFTGSVCIHPRQVAVVNAGFGPTADEMLWARKVLAADAQARAEGKGAVLLEGRMIDAPIVERAKRWMEKSGD